eukprot:jgi/Picre1/28548/NNA_003950.t1
MKLPPGYVAGQGVVKGSAYGGFGERMLKSLGWEKGKGLGKEEQGMKEAIEVKKKEDNIGVGGGPSTDWKDAWWEDAFNSAAKGVNVECSSSSSSSDDDSSDDDDEATAVGRKNRDGTLASASQQELKLLEELSASAGRVAAGRFGGRDAKMERIRRQEALEAERLAAKLGLSIKRDESQDVVETHPKKKTRNLASEKLEEKREKKDKAGRIVIECGSDGKDGGQERLPEPTPRHGWWGCNLFISAGSLAGAALELPVEKKKSGFSEVQQARIYNDAQKGKTTGKTGLGKGKRGTIKVDGVVWEGKKTTFDEEPEDTKSTKDLEREADGKSKKRKAKNGDVKWRKVISKVLKKTRKDAKPNKGIKMTSLHKNVRKMLISTYSISMRKEEVKEGVEKALRKNKGNFLCVGEYVKLT